MTREETEGSPVPYEAFGNLTDGWTWNRYDKSDEVLELYAKQYISSLKPCSVCLQVALTGKNSRTALFHPNWSNGSAGVRGTRPLLQGLTYWEVHASLFHQYYSYT